MNVNYVFIVKPENTWTLSETQNLTSLARLPNLAELENECKLNCGLYYINPSYY